MISGEHKQPSHNPQPCTSAANFKRPIVIMGPLNDIAMEKLARELPDDYEAAGQFLLTFDELKWLPHPPPPLTPAVFERRDGPSQRSRQQLHGHQTGHREEDRREGEQQSEPPSFLFSPTSSNAEVILSPRTSTPCWTSRPLQWRG